MTDLLELGLSNAAMATVLAIVAFGLSRVYRRPAFVHGLWLVVLLKLVTPPLVSVPLPWFDAVEPEVAEAGTSAVFVLAEPDVELTDKMPAALENVGITDLAAAAPETTEAWFLPSWSLLIMLVWLTGSVCRLVWITRSILVFRRLLRFARLADDPIQDIVKELAGRLKLSRHPAFWLIPGKISPMLWGLGRPRLIFPADLLGRLDREQLRTILLHELAHWRRRDHWVRCLELAVSILYWWHPAAWWARAELREAEEQCCDAWVVGTLDGADRTYALALLETVAFFSDARLPLPVSASGIGPVSQLRRRLTMIMNGQKSRSLTWAGCAGLTAFGLLLLPLLPVRGQQPERKEAVIVIDGKDFKIHFGGGGAGGPDQEAVELLKRALKLLGEKKTPPTPGPATPPGSPEEVKKAREQVDALTQEVAAQRRQMEAVEAKLRDAKSRLAKLEGKKGGSEIRMLIMPSAPVPPVPPAAKRVPTPPEGLPALRGLQLLVMPDGKAVIVSGEKKEKASAEELTKRLERLQHEVEQLRREIQQAPPADVRKRK